MSNTENNITAYELSEKKNKIIGVINYLEGEISGNNTETVLLTNDEVQEVIIALGECINFINRRLMKVVVQ